MDQSDENKIKIKIELCPMEVTPTVQVVATSTILNNIELELQENLSNQEDPTTSYKCIY
ncbi:21994_t:CDS:2 [Dentiscutata erythropus]|uniref:21994_t:CDS:1 n=1 Tax=Dentiscutata erythropus TaxID=1348616 RepID=A0A9N9C4G3_9GLOM|nr:21994_t:CDS:2 [Dentiscutata erythropus]